MSDAWAWRLIAAGYAIRWFALGMIELSLYPIVGPWCGQ